MLISSGGEVVFKTRGSSHADISSRRLAVELGEDEWAFVDIERERLLGGRYILCRAFHEDCATVETHQGWGVINGNEEWVIEPNKEYEEMLDFDAVSGTAPVKIDGLWQLASANGRLVRFDGIDIQQSFLGYYGVCVEREGSQSYVIAAGLDGSVLLDGRFEELGNIEKEFFSVRTTDDWRIVNLRGDVLFIVQDAMWLESPASNRCLIQRDEAEFQFVGMNGQDVFGGATFSYAESFVGGAAEFEAEANDRWSAGYIGLSGEIIWTPREMI